MSPFTATQVPASPVVERSLNSDAHLLETATFDPIPIEDISYELGASDRAVSSDRSGTNAWGGEVRVHLSPDGAFSVADDRARRL